MAFNILVRMYKAMSKLVNINRLRLLDPKKTAFFLCDVQEKFRPVMPLFGALIKNASKLLSTAKEFEVPLFVTEQYPEKLGNTAKELDISHACCVMPKTRFSMLVPEVECKMEEVFGKKPRDVVLFGIEAHVCVEQTAMQLIDNDINVFLVTDCSCSRQNQDRNMAFGRLRQYGCVMTTYESVIFNLLQDKNHPKFRNIQKLVKDPSADMKLA